MVGVFGKMSPGGGGGTIESSAACLSVGNPRYWRSLRGCSFRAVCIVGRGNVFSLLYNIPTTRVCVFFFLLNTGKRHISLPSLRCFSLVVVLFSRSQLWRDRIYITEERGGGVPVT